ncbi:hypothetical protein HDU81_005291 [Chytriomyces hyalinus]|nr:hypothetical protein HDU81_005291 [Chytriomyces hyalinus]
MNQESHPLQFDASGDNSLADQADEDARTDVADAMLKAMIPMNQTRFSSEDSAKLDKLATLLERISARSQGAYMMQVAGHLPFAVLSALINSLFFPTPEFQPIEKLLLLKATNTLVLTPPKECVAPTLRSHLMNADALHQSLLRSIKSIARNLSSPFDVRQALSCFTRRSLDSGEASHPLCEATSWRTNFREFIKATDAPLGTASVVTTLDMFKRGLSIFAPSLEKVCLAQDKVVLAGSAVTACLLPWPQDIVELYEKETRQLAAIWKCLSSLWLPTEILRKIDAFSQLSYNAKLAVNEALFKHFHDPRTSPFFAADIDLFFIANDAHSDAEQVSKNFFATYCDILFQRRKVDLKSMVSMSMTDCRRREETWIQRVPASDGLSNKPEQHTIRYRGRRGKMSTRFRDKDARGWTLYRERRVAEELAPRHVLRTTNSITIVGMYPVRHAQLMLNVLRSKDELMLVCDQDCTAVVYDGTNVYANPRSLRAFNTRTNYVEARHLEENARVSRMKKYGGRGFSTLMLEICKHYPRCDVELSKKYCSILKNAPMRVTDWSAKFKSNGSVIDGNGPIYLKSREDDYALHYDQASVPYCNFRIDSRNLHWSIQALLDKQERKEPAKRLFKQIPDTASTYEGFHEEITKPGDESGRFSPLTFKHIRSAKASNVFQFSLSFESCYMCGEKVPAEKSDETWRMPVCRDCNNVNVAKRNASANLNGKFAVVTGARIKIGQQAALKLLRYGATVHATTRFPLLLLNYFKSLPDSGDWWDRLFVHGLDFRNMTCVLEFCSYLNRTLPKLDILIQNAAQTIQRTAEFNAALYGAELALLKTIEPSDKQKWRQVRNSVDATSEPYLLKAPNEEYAEEKFSNVDGRSLASSAFNSLAVHSGPQHEHSEETEQQIKINNEWDMSLGTDPLDSRSVTTWTQSLPDVSTSEIAEVMIINSIAPTLLMQQLLPLLSKKNGSAASPSFVVNVSSREGIFNPGQSDANGELAASGAHPHTNMAKALNRLTQTCAGEFLKVDPGWVS